MAPVRPTRADDLPRGALLMVASALLFACMGVAVKIAAQTLPNTMVVFFRSALGLFALAPWLARLGRAGLRTAHVREHLVRSLAGLASMYCFFYALGHMRLADAILLNYSIPLFMPFVESAWLGEPFPRRLLSVILLGFAGVLLILKPGQGLFQPVALLGLCSAFFASVAQVGIRQLTRTEPATRIVFYFGLISTVVSALPLAQQWRNPRPLLWGVLAAMGVLATLGQLALTRAYAHAPAGRVGPFIYTAVVFAALLDWVFWGALPDRLSIAGALVVTAAGIIALRIEAAGQPAARSRVVE
jgi:drug/metabolite transporter (DMT)-like permease